MNILIAGDGEVGFYLARMLSVVEDHNIVVVDPHSDLLERLEASTDLLTITGDSCSVSVLDQANVRNMDLLISVLHEEEPNLLTCIIGKKMGAKRTIARVNTVEMNRDDRRAFFSGLGVDRCVCPERIASNEIVNLLQHSGTAEVFNFGQNLLRLMSLRINDDAPLVGKTLARIAEEYPHLDFRAVAVHRNRRTIIPMGGDTLMAGDLVYVIVRPESAEAFFALTGTHDKKINNVMIAGAGRIGKQTTLRIEKDMKVKLIEKDRRRCEEVAAEVSSDTLIINGDATDLDVLRDEGMERMDAFIAVTDSTETNIMACLYAKKAGVHTTIALVENIDYIDLAQTVGVDTIINKKLITASYIARFTMNAEVESSKVLSGVDAEVLEFVVKPDAKVTRRAIKHLHLPEGSIIGGVIRGSQSFIAVGDFRIEAGDRVVVFAEPYAVRKLPGLFN